MRRRIPIVLIAIPLVGTLMAAQTRIFTSGTPEEIERARALARSHLAKMASAAGIDASDLTIFNAQIDPLSMAHVRVRQSYHGIPIVGAEAIVHLRSNGEVSGETNNLISGINVDTQPRVSASDAVAKAVESSGCPRCTAVPAIPELAIVRHEGVDHLTYRVQLRGLADARPSLPVVFVDAHDGLIVQRYDNLQTGGVAPTK
jgi:Zn-dependent metalloprotease